MSLVELIYDADCPNITAARHQLMRAFAALGVEPKWQEWERGAAGSPAYVCDFASPTILVNGRDVARSAAIAGSGACRVYTDESGRLSRVPALEDITTALSADGPEERKHMNAHDAKAVARASTLGIRSVPAVAIDGVLAGCCAGRGPDEIVLRAAGLGQLR